MKTHSPITGSPPQKDKHNTGTTSKGVKSLGRKAALPPLPRRFIVKGDARSHYIIDRVIIYAFLAVMLTTLVVILYNQGFSNQLYLTCKGPTPCGNPLYGQDCNAIKAGVFNTIKVDDYVCTTDTLYPGFVYGQAPDALTDNAPFLLVTLALLAIIINHFYWNNGGEYNMIVKITVTPKTQAGLDAINKHFKEIGFKERTFMRATKTKQEQLSDGSLQLKIPCSVTLTNATWEDLAHTTMKANGSSPDDYTVTVNTE